ILFVCFIAYFVDNLYLHSFPTRRSSDLAALALELRVAREWKVPHSTLIRDWTSRDLSLAMADLLARDDIGPCGHPHSESTKPERSEEHTSELQSQSNLVCRLLLEKKKTI